MKYKKFTIQILKMPSGDSLDLQGYKFYGKGEKKVYVQANIHGPELTGILVARKLVNYLKKYGGDFKEFTIVPSCNPFALSGQFIGQLTGYVNPLTGKNWNRIYPDPTKFVNFNDKTNTWQQVSKKIHSAIIKELAVTEDLETKLGLTLLSLSWDADIVIDLHTAWGKAPHYVYCYPDQLIEAKKFNIENIFLLDPQVFIGVFDEANLYPFYSYIKFFPKTKLTKQVFTVELGDDCSLEQENIELGFSEVISYLTTQEVISKKSDIFLKEKFDICLQKNYVYYYSPIGGLLVWLTKTNEYFHKGDKIGIIENLKSQTSVPVFAQHDGKMIIQFNAKAIYQGQQICKVMSFYVTEKRVNV